MFFSVIVCTYNRCESLKETLNSLIAQEKNDGFDYEILVVDNNSTDKTRETAQVYIERHGQKIRYFFEPNQGLSFARNRGIKESRGDIIAFTDDDCIADKNWLYYLFVGYVEHHASCVGGKINPLWSGPRPDWLTKKLYVNLALLDYGDELLIINDKKQLFYGANFSFHKELLSQIGLYNTNLGRKGSELFGGEDNEMFNNIFLTGKKILYQPKAVVFHQVPAQRLTKRYFRKHYFDSYRCLDRNVNPDPKMVKIFGINRYLFKNLIKNVISYLKALISLKHREAFELELIIWGNCGQMYESYMSSRKQ